MAALRVLAVNFCDYAHSSVYDDAVLKQVRLQTESGGLKLLMA
jgi:hypothetical protein